MAHSGTSPRDMSIVEGNFCEHWVPRVHCALVGLSPAGEDARGEAWMKVAMHARYNLVLMQRKWRIPETCFLVAGSIERALCRIHRESHH